VKTIKLLFPIFLCLILLLTASTEAFAQRKKTAGKGTTAVKKTTPVQEQTETQSQSLPQSPAPVKEADSSATLEETMEWLGSKLIDPNFTSSIWLDGKSRPTIYMNSPDYYNLANPQRVNLRTHPNSRTVADGDVINFNAKYKVEGCSLLFSIEPVFRNIELLTNKSANYKSQITINFSDIEPISSTGLELITTNSKKTILYESDFPSFEEGFVEKYKAVSKMNIYVNGDENQKRMIKAIKHTIKLCGGKVEPF
jgi:hypothetical protein